MKKIIIFLIVIITLFNFIFCNVALAEGGTLDLDDPTTGNDFGTSNINEQDFSERGLKGLIENGIASDMNRNGRSIQSQIFVNLVDKVFFGSIVGILSVVMNIFPMLIQLLMISIVYTNLRSIKFVTIEDIVFNKISLFDVNYFNFNGPNAIANSIKDSVAKYYYILRLVAVAFSLLTLIYVGIRMVLSVTADGKSKYKQMLIGWVESAILLFVLQYIISVILKLGNISINIVAKLKDTSVTGVSFERKILDEIVSILFLENGWTYFVYSIIFWILVYVQTKFFLSYAKRFITVGFLIMIAPLITVIYPIDKANDGKTQVFNHWFLELSMNIFIQPIHAIIYLLFMYLAGEIAKTSILVALLFLLGLTKVEKIVFQLFHIGGMSLHMVSEERKKG